jgi:predicted nucleic acid-binding protein
MNLLFVDTAGWMACADSAAAAHLRCRLARDEWLKGGGVLVTTDYVIDETLTLIRLRIGLEAAESWWEQCVQSARLRREAIDDLRADKARSLFFRLRDKTLSFTDCTSFVVMRELGVSSVLTLDHHFAQMRFKIMP